MKIQGQFMPLPAQMRGLSVYTPKGLAAATSRLQAPFPQTAAELVRGREAIQITSARSAFIGKIDSAYLRAVASKIDFSRIVLKFSTDNGCLNFEIPGTMLFAAMDTGNKDLLFETFLSAAQTIRPEITRKHFEFFDLREVGWETYCSLTWRNFIDLVTADELPQFTEVPEEFYQTTNLADAYSIDSAPAECMMSAEMPQDCRLIGVPYPSLYDLYSNHGVFASRVVFMREGQVYCAFAEKPVPVHGFIKSPVSIGVQLAVEICALPVAGSGQPYHEQMSSKRICYAALAKAGVRFPISDSYVDPRNITVNPKYFHSEKVVIKPVNGLGGYGVEILPNDAVAVGERVLQRCQNCEEIIVQEYIETPDEYCFADESGRTMEWVAGVFVGADGQVPERVYIYAPKGGVINPYHGAKMIGEEELFDRLKLLPAQRDDFKTRLNELGSNSFHAMNHWYRQAKEKMGRYDEKDLPSLVRLDVRWNGKEFVVLEVNVDPGELSMGGGAAKYWANVAVESARKYRESLAEDETPLVIDKRLAFILRRHQRLDERMQELYKDGLEFAFEEYKQGRPLIFYEALMRLFSYDGQGQLMLELIDYFIDLLLQDSRDHDGRIKNLCSYALLSRTVPAPQKEKYLEMLLKFDLDFADLMTIAGYYARQNKFDLALHFMEGVDRVDNVDNRILERRKECAFGAGDVTYLERLSRDKQLTHIEEAKLAILKGDFNRANFLMNLVILFMRNQPKKTPFEENLESLVGRKEGETVGDENLQTINLDYLTMILLDGRPTEAKKYLEELLLAPHSTAIHQAGAGRISVEVEDGYLI